MRIVIYSVGNSHQLYFNLSDEEAERRWNAQRSNVTELELAHEQKMGWKVVRSVEENIDDQLFIWGDAGAEINSIVQDLFLVMAKDGQNSGSR